MELRNDQGSPIDPTPFLVVAGLAFLVCYSYFPITFLEIGLSMSDALAATTLGFAATTVVAYHRLVRTARPDLRGEIPLHDRLRNLIYTAMVATAVMVLFALIAVAR